MARADKNSINEYLLGRLTEPDEEQVELRLLTDREFAEEYDIVVNEIIDEYISGKFEGEELKQVEEYFFKSPERKSKLKFALALKDHGKRARPVVTSEPAVFQSREAVVARPPKWKFTQQLAIAASILMVIGAGFEVWRLYFYQSDLNKGLVALRTAFENERPTEARLSDFIYAPLPNQRGEPPKIDYVKRDLAASLLLKAVNEHPTAAAHHALGQYYLANREFDKAIDQLNKALALDANNAKTHSDLGAALLEQGKIQASAKDKDTQLATFAKSFEHLKNALDLDNSLLEALFNRALVSQALLPSRQAEEAWRDYLKKDSSSPWADEARRNLQLLEENRRQTSWNIGGAIRSFEAAWRAGDEDAAWEVVSQSYTSGGNEVANGLLDAVLEMENGSERDDQNGSLKALAYLAKLEFSRSGDRYTTDVVKYYERSNSRRRPALMEARRHMKAGYTFFGQSNYADAISEYSEAKLKYEVAGATTEEAFADYRLAHCLLLSHDLRNAQLALRRLAALCETSNYSWLFAQSLYSLAHANFNSSQYSMASDYSIQALAKFERAGDPNGVLKCLTQLATINDALNRTDRSLGYLSRGLALNTLSQADPMQRWGLFVQMALSLSAIQLHEAALYYQKEALSVALEMGRPLIISRSYGFLGSTYAAMRRYAEAVREATKGFDTGKSIGESVGGIEIMANASMQLGDIHQQAAECDKAIEAYDRSIELYGKLNVEYFMYAAHKGKLLCFAAASNSRAMREELQTVVSLSDGYRTRITAESQRVSFFAMEQSVFDLAISYEFNTMNDKVMAFQYSEQSHARSLLDAMRRRTEVLKKSYGPDLNLPAVATAMSLTEIQSRMPADAQILQYAVLDDRILFWIVNRSGIHAEEFSLSSQALTEKIREYIATVNAPPTGDSAKPSERARDLHQILISRAEPYLDKSKFLCIVPDKVLHYLPFGALISPSTGRFFLEDYEIGVAPSSSIFIELTEAAAQNSRSFDEKVLSVGNPSFDKAAFDTLPDLAAAAREAQKVASFYPRRRVLRGDEATEAVVRFEMSKADVLHLAMHYVVNERSEMLSGFPLARDSMSQTKREEGDGFLQSYEVYMMRLPRTRLVILSACRTGIEQDYRGEGASSGARAFLVAGVPTVVASLWPVNSDSSAELMENFHRHRMVDRLSTTKALRQAQIEMAQNSNSKFQHPYYWAAFVTIGGRTPL